eukprot:m.336174 g.336174  ORF g.336174 m.336174 type:complete len:352 (-) comp20531_c0_seq11:452-1507(-)
MTTRRSLRARRSTSDASESPPAMPSLPELSGDPVSRDTEPSMHSPGSSGLPNSDVENAETPITRVNAQTPPSLQKSSYPYHNSDRDLPLATRDASRNATTVRFTLNACHGESKPIIVRHGMDRAELERCIRHAFRPVHQIKEVHGVYVGASLLPLAVLAESPEMVNGAECTVAVHPEFVAPSPPRNPMLFMVKRMALLIAAVSVVIGVVYWYAFAGEDPISLAIGVLWRAIDPSVRELYRNGPQFSVGGISIGFWEGMEMHDVCARVTTHDGTFWSKHPEECVSIYRRKEDSFVFLVNYAIMALALWKMLAALPGVLLWTVLYPVRLLMRTVMGGGKRRPTGSVAAPLSSR